MQVTESYCANLRLLNPYYANRSVVVSKNDRTRSALLNANNLGVPRFFLTWVSRKPRKNQPSIVIKFFSEKKKDANILVCITAVCV